MNTLKKRASTKRSNMLFLAKRVVPITYLAVGFAQIGTAQDCDDQAVSNYESGLSAAADQRYADAVDLLEQASNQCDVPAYWQALGDARRSLSDAAPEAVSDDGQTAIEAYGKAFASARSAQDDAAGAQAARSIVDMGLRNNDPLKAQNWLAVASRLDPQSPELTDLENRLDAARDQLSADEIDTGLSQTRGIGTVNSLLGGAVSSNAFWEPDDENSGGAGSAELAVSGSVVAPTPAASVDIPIRFASNSTELTEETATNVRNLAKVLAARASKNQIILTGHADVRGDASYNQRLSLARAEAIRAQLVLTEPSLEGRIRAQGAGESRPVDLGDSERSHANNRRLEVTVTDLASESSPGN
ncbi:MAG: OmpA family protein [Pseudomonadota bacterium]